MNKKKKYYKNKLYVTFLNKMYALLDCEYYFFQLLYLYNSPYNKG